jgi:hypothetical protein
MSDDPKKEPSGAPKGGVRPETDAVTAPGGASLSGAGAFTAAGAVTVAGGAVLSGAGAATVDEGKLLHNIVRERVRLPEDVLKVEFRFGEDSTGAPAVWIVFVANDDLKPSKSKIARLQRVAEEVRSIVQSRTSRWPYIEIATQ